MHRMAAVQIALHVKLRQPDAGAELAVLHEQMVAFAAKLEHPDAGALESPYGRLPCPCRSAAKDRKSGGAQVVDGSATKKNPKSTPAGGLARSGFFRISTNEARQSRNGFNPKIWRSRGSRMDSDGRSGRTAGTEAVRREELDVLAPNTDGQQEGDETGERGYHVTREKAGRPLLTSPITAEPLSQLRGSQFCAI